MSRLNSFVLIFMQKVEGGGAPQKRRSKANMVVTPMALDPKRPNFNVLTVQCYPYRMAKGPRNRAAKILAAVIFVAATASTVGAQQCSVKPAAISLDETVRLQCEGAANNNIATARLKDRTIKMFKQPDGSWQGLMPVAVADIPGVYSVEFLAADGETIDAAKLTIRPTVFPTQNVNLAPQIEDFSSSICGARFTFCVGKTVGRIVSFAASIVSPSAARNSTEYTPGISATAIGIRPCQLPSGCLNIFIVRSFSRAVATLLFAAPSHSRRTVSPSDIAAGL